jgi:hypothetical protein
MSGPNNSRHFEGHKLVNPDDSLHLIKLLDLLSPGVLVNFHLDIVVPEYEIVGGADNKHVDLFGHRHGEGELVLLYFPESLLVAQPAGLAVGLLLIVDVQVPELAADPVRLLLELLQPLGGLALSQALVEGQSLEG